MATALRLEEAENIASSDNNKDAAPRAKFSKKVLVIALTPGRRPFTHLAIHSCRGPLILFLSTARPDRLQQFRLMSRL